jgi:hydrogenase maturation protease
MPKRAVIGIGNILMGDDGIGPLLIERAKERFGHIPDVVFLDEGTIGFGLVHVIKDYDEVIIIDSGDMGKVPGEFGIFSLEEVKSSKFCQGLSLHESDLLKVLEASRAMGELPARLRILAIQPKEIGWSGTISRELTERIGDYLDALRIELGIDGTP